MPLKLMYVTNVYHLIIFPDKMYYPCEVSMEEPFPRQMGNKSSHALKLQQHLHDQMMSQSDFCDVTLVVKNVVSIPITFSNNFGSGFRDLFFVW